ncbi:MAG: trichohyalin-plectin-homology domain domain-containing protein [archaeon]|nr:trichohyalin-plectin-homology domain domain-containing protein [archaeon]
MKTDKRIEKKRMMDQQRKFEDEQNRLLDDKRRRLRNLLAAEEAQYHQEIIDSQETPEQVRKKMEEKLLTLRAQRENETDDMVKKLEEKRFFAGADQLRKNEAEAFAVSCYLEQENQMLDKLKRRQKERREEEVYCKLNEFDNAQKAEKEKLDEIKKKQKIKQTYDYLQWQRQEAEEALKKANEINALEKARLKEQWRLDDLNEQENLEKRKQMNKQVYKDIFEFNKKEEIERKKKADYEKVKDKELVDSIVQKEKALDDIDKAEKERKIKEFHQNKKYLEYIMNQKKEAELWMDKIAQEEADREYYKKQAKWKKEEDKRIELLKAVYKGREEAVRYKQGLKENEKNLLAQERAAADEDLLKYKAQIEEINKKEAARRKEHQNELMYQISEKEYQKRRELQDKLYEERAAQLWEMEYQKKINEQREIHLKKLAEIRSRGGENL